MFCLSATVTHVELLINTNTKQATPDISDANAYFSASSTILVLSSLEKTLVTSPRILEIIGVAAPVAIELKAPMNIRK